MRECKEYFASISKDHPTRLGAFAAMPFPDIQATLDEIKYALDVLKLDVIGLMTNVGGQCLVDPEFAPIFDEMNRRKAVVCMHPNDPRSSP